jgi:hypothetical protein
LTKTMQQVRWRSTSSETVCKFRQNIPLSTSLIMGGEGVERLGYVVWAAHWRAEGGRIKPQQQQRVDLMFWLAVDEFSTARGRNYLSVHCVWLSAVLPRYHTLHSAPRTAQ